MSMHICLETWEGQNAVECTPDVDLWTSDEDLEDMVLSWIDEDLEQRLVLIGPAGGRVGAVLVEDEHDAAKMINRWREQYKVHKDT